MSRKYSNNKVKDSGEILSYPNKFTVVDYENAQNVLTY
jgi:hypothetical protein